MADHIATAETEIERAQEKVWDGADGSRADREVHVRLAVVTDWKPGSPIVWKGEYEGKKYEDKGQILEVDRGERLKNDPLQPLERPGGRPENYHTLVYELSERRGRPTSR